MKNNFIDLIAEYYWNSDKFDAPKRTQEEKEFYSKYIEPVVKENIKKGNDMEGCYFDVIASWQNTAFKHGLKAGIAIMTELLD